MFFPTSTVSVCVSLPALYQYVFPYQHCISMFFPYQHCISMFFPYQHCISVSVCFSLPALYQYVFFLTSTVSVCLSLPAPNRYGTSPTGLHPYVTGPASTSLLILARDVWLPGNSNALSALMDDASLLLEPSVNLELSESAEASEGRSNRLNNRDLRDRNDAAFVSSFTAILQHVSDTLQALVYDILPSTSAVFSYVIGSKKLSANEQFFFVLFLLVLKQ